MAPLSLLTFMTYVLSVCGKLVNLDGTAQLTVDGSCAGGEMQLVRVMAGPYPIPRTVATLVRGVWEPAEHYKDRIHHVSTSTVNLTRANLNDNEGAFEFTCNSGRIGKPIQLVVVFPHSVSVSEGETARIPCHFPSEGIQGKSARWERDGEPVLVQNRSSGQPEGKLSVSPNCIQTGDLSLTVNDAQLEDGGSYVCYTVDGNGVKTRGSPAAVTVTVQRSRPAPTGAPHQTPDEKRIGTELIVSITLNVLLFIAAVTFCVLWRVSVRKTLRAAGDGPATDKEMEPLGGDPDHVPNGGAHRAEP